MRTAVVDNMQMAYDELEHGLNGAKISLLRVQYGVKCKQLVVAGHHMVKIYPTN